MSPRARATAATLALTATLGLSACGVASPVQTDVPYNAADGVPVDLGPVVLRNVALVSGAAGENATVTGQAINNGAEGTQLVFADATGTTSATVSLPPHSSTSLSASTQIILQSVPAAPGDMIALNVSSPAGGTAAVNIPVLAPTGYYATMAPTATATATSTPTG